MSLAKAANCNPFPIRKPFALKYADEKILVTDVVGLAATILTFNLNSLYAPSNGTYAAQPMFYDQLCAASGPYTRYCVEEVDIEIAFYNASTGDTWGIAQIAPNGDTSGITTIDMHYLKERPLVDVVQVGDTHASDDMQIMKINKLPMWFINGYKDNEAYIADPNNSSTYNNNPSNVTHLVLGNYDMAAGSSVVLRAEVTIIQRGHFFGRFGMAHS